MKTSNDHKEFSEFVGVKRITGGYIASAILKTLNQLGLSVDNLRGQCYDRARNMSREVAGVQGIMKCCTFGRALKMRICNG